MTLLYDAARVGAEDNRSRVGNFVGCEGEVVLAIPSRWATEDYSPIRIPKYTIHQKERCFRCRNGFCHEILPDPDFFGELSHLIGDLCWVSAFLLCQLE